MAASADWPDFQTDSAVTVAADSYTDLLIVPLPVTGASRVTVTVSTVTQNLDGFKVQRQVYEGGAWTDYLTDSDFDSVSANLLYVDSTGPHEITDGNSATFDFVPGAVNALKLQASAATDSAAVSVVGRWIREG